MGTAITTMTVMAGMAFSLGSALLMEELIFGKVFPQLFARISVKQHQRN